MTKLQLALKRGPSPSSESRNRNKPKRRKKLTTIETPLAAGSDSPGKTSLSHESSYPKSSQPSTIQSGSPCAATLMPNFCDARDLCLHITRACKRPFGGLNSCFGHLKVSSITHELYLEDQGCHVEGAMSLNELMSNMAERHRTDPLDRLPLLECIRVARNVAFSVLQFHSTPLLNPWWTGSDIVFYGYKAHNAAGSSSPPTTSHQIPAPSIRINVSTEDSQTISRISRREKRIRNDYLFQLGVSLLEIAYQAPLRDISLMSTATERTDFEIADHCSRKVAAILGPRYARIVRRCLGCDFGEDVDLDCEGLRLAVHQTVILELEGLEQDFERK